MKKILLKSRLALGDAVVMSAAVESLHTQFPNKYKTAVETGAMEIWQHNPNVVPVAKDFKVINMHYNSINKSNQITNNFLSGYVEHLASELKIDLKLQTNHPHLYLTDEEKNKYKELKPYSIMVCGGKLDYTTKHLSVGHLQTVVDHYIGKISFIQPAIFQPNHIHYPLQNVKTMSKITLRNLLSLIYNCDFCIGPITAHQHIAAAFEKSYIAIAGGRESITWIQNYPRQHTLHSIGTLPCCQKACWKSRVTPLNDGNPKDKDLCEKPIFFQSQWIPKCISLIKPSSIIDIIDRITVT